MKNGATFVPYKGLSYNDIGIVPRLGIVKSRSEIPYEGFRVIVAGMSSVIGEEFLKEWRDLPNELRCSIHIPRDKNSIKHLKMIAEWGLQNWIFVGVGLKTPEIEDIAVELGYKNVLLDIAFGGLPQLKNAITKLKIKFGSDAVIATGSISTEEQAHYLDSIGVNIFRTGMAVGKVCSSKVIAGAYMGTVTELKNISSYIDNREDIFIMADGGFQYPGDFIKAFLLGASYCMSGYIFTKCKSAQMHIDGTNEYYGMSNKNRGIRAGETTYDESFVKKSDDKNLYSLFDLLTKLWGGIRSGVSYSGYASLNESIGNGTFIELKVPISDELSVW